MRDQEIELRYLEAIIQYGMTSKEAKACKVCSIYQATARSIFPHAYHYRPTKGDPRKSSLFKYCYKLLREFDNLIEDSNYTFYVRAQMDIIKSMCERHGNDPDIQPTCLVGEKAWKRWMVWKKLYDKKVGKAELIGTMQADPLLSHKICIALTNTKSFLSKKLPALNKKSVQNAYQNRIMLRWIACGQITPYYALLSPILNNWLKERNLQIVDIFHIDFDFYRPAITDQIKQFFANEYSHEF